MMRPPHSVGDCVFCKILYLGGGLGIISIPNSDRIGLGLIGINRFWSLDVLLYRRLCWDNLLDRPLCPFSKLIPSE